MDDDNAARASVEFQLSPVNTLELKETKSSRTITARFTDRAVDRIGGPLTAFFAGRRVAHVPDSGSIDHGVDTVEMTTSDSNGAGSPTVAEPAPSGAARQLQQSSELDRLEEVFRIAGEGVHLDITDLKASSKLDAARRLTLLFLYAKESLGSELSARSELNDLLNDAGLNDGNTRHWIANDATIRWDPATGMIGLRSPARTKAREYLSDVLDTSVAGKYQLGYPVKPRHKKLASQGNEPTERKSSSTRGQSPSKNAELWLRQWEEKRAALGYDNIAIHKALNSAPRAHTGTVALWAIRLATADAVKDVSTHDLSSFLWSAFDVKVDRRNLDRALRSDEARDRVQNVTGSVFRILPGGADLAESIVPRAAAAAAQPPKKTAKKT